MRKRCCVKSHQPSGHYRRDDAGNGNTVPRSLAIHECLKAAENLVSDNDCGKDVAAGLSSCLADGKRYRNVVAGMPADRRTVLIHDDHVIVEIEDAQLCSVCENGVRDIDAALLADDGARSVRAHFPAERNDASADALRRAGNCAADGIQHQKLGLMDAGLGDIGRLDIEGPGCETLRGSQRARSVMVVLHVFCRACKMRGGIYSANPKLFHPERLELQGGLKYTRSFQSMNRPRSR